MRTPPTIAAVGVVAAVLLSACGESQSQQPGERPAADPSTPVASAEAENSAEQEKSGGDVEPDLDLPQTPAGEAVRHVLKVLNGPQDSTAEDWEGRLHQDALAELSPADLATTLNTTIRPQGPWTVQAYEGDQAQAVTRLEGPSAELSLHIAVDGTDQLISTLFFAEAPEPAETAESFQEIEQRLVDFPADVRALILQDGEPLLDLGADEPAPVASTAKLYPLLATVDAIDAGQTSWDETLELTDDLRSLPSGTLQDQPEGFTTSVYDVAHRMIEVSDNTGTDMLIDHLGRDAVEEAVAEAGHHRPDLLSPFPSTRELFQLRWGHPEMAAQWIGADEQQRRELLQELSDVPLEIEYEELGADDVDHEVDWRASAYDIAAAHHQLAERADEHPELVSILGSNPGLTAGVEDPWWQSLAFKGGSLPGVLTGSWHAMGDDGERTVVLLAEHEDAAELQGEAHELFTLAEDALTVEQ